MTTTQDNGTCDCCGGARPQGNLDSLDQYLRDRRGGYCPGYVTRDQDGDVLGCGAWRAEAYQARQEV